MSAQSAEHAVENTRSSCLARLGLLSLSLGVLLPVMIFDWRDIQLDRFVAHCPFQFLRLGWINPPQLWNTRRKAADVISHASEGPVWLPESVPKGYPRG